MIFLIYIVYKNVDIFKYYFIGNYAQCVHICLLEFDILKIQQHLIIITHRAKCAIPIDMKR